MSIDEKRQVARRLLSEDLLSEREIAEQTGLSKTEVNRLRHDSRYVAHDEDGPKKRCASCGVLVFEATVINDECIKCQNASRKPGLSSPIDLYSTPHNPF